MRLVFVLIVKLATNFLLTILVHSVALVLNTVTTIKPASIALLIVLNAQKMVVYNVMKVFIFSRIKHAVWHAMVPSTLTQTATVKINPTTAIQLILQQVSARSAETCLRVVSSPNIAYLAAVLAANSHNVKVINLATTVAALICLQIVKAETQASTQQWLALSVQVVTKSLKASVLYRVILVINAMTPRVAINAAIQTARDVTSMVIVRAVLPDTSWLTLQTANNAVCHAITISTLTQPASVEQYLTTVIQLILKKVRARSALREPIILGWRSLLRFA